MGETTAISWTDSTFSPWVGCSRVSPGCAHCYASDYDKRVGGVPGSKKKTGDALLRFGPGAPRTRTSAAYWKQPLRWNKEAEKAGVRHKVFCGSLCDVCDAEVPEEWRADLFALILATPSLDWLLLTKRPENFAEMMHPDFGAVNDAARRLLGRPDIAVLPTQRHGMVPGGWPPPNVWLGVTVENQEQAEKRIPLLLAQDAAVRFLSIEPQLGPVDLRMGGMSLPDYAPHRPLPAISWVIVGGESGAKARPFDLAWARSLRDQCKAAGVPCFVKQLGAAPFEDGSGVGCQFALELKHRSGADPTEWPEDLRVREFPGHSKEEG